MLGKLQSLCQSRRDFLRSGADLHAMNMPVSAQAAIHKIDHTRGNGKAEAFTATTFREDESIDADHRAVHVDQRSAAVSRIDRSVSLYVGEGLARICLAGERAYDSHGDGVLQTLGTADGKYQLSDMGPFLADERQRGKIRLVDLEQCEITFFVLTEQLGLDDATLANRNQS